jgi:hypothetical protein
MKKVVLVLTLILLLLLVGCIEPQQANTEDPFASYKQSLLPAFQGDIAPLGEIPRYRIAISLHADALTLGNPPTSVICCNNMPFIAYYQYGIRTPDRNRGPRTGF